MNDLCVDIGYKSINHVGEQLCGDHVDIVDQGDDSQVIVLADGLGSGVKASTITDESSPLSTTSTWSPHSCSPIWFTLL